MKERIVIDKEKVIAFSSKGLDVYSQEYVEEIDVIENTKKVEQVPETFEELKELCVKKFRLVFSKNINMEKENEYIVCCWMNFYENGDILNRDGFVIAQNKTPQQIWQIINNFIGEE